MTLVGRCMWCLRFETVICSDILCHVACLWYVTLLLWNSYGKWCYIKWRLHCVVLCFVGVSDYRMRGRWWLGVLKECRLWLFVLKYGIIQLGQKYKLILVLHRLPLLKLLFSLFSVTSIINYWIYSLFCFYEKNLTFTLAVKEFFCT